MPGTRFAVPALFAFAAFAATPAAAAPQALGLIASADPAPFQCTYGECSAELTAICLQPDRATPTRGATYLPGESASQIVVTAMTKHGRVRISATEIDFSALRSHVAVKASIPAREMRARGWSALEISVEPLATLLPAPVDGEPLPMSRAEADEAAGELRRIAAAYVDDSASPRIAAARLTNQIVNRLPADDAATPLRRATAVREAMDGADAGAEAQSMVERAVSDCNGRLAGPSYTLRHCLGQKHDHFVGKLNNEYWDGLSAGM